MPNFSPTQAAFEGFRFTRERPGAVGAWAAATFCFNMVSGILGALVGGDALRAFEALGGHPTIGEMIQVLPPALAPLLVTLLINFAGAAFVYASALRSFIGIDKSVTFHVGADERRIFCILLIFFLIYITLNIVVGATLGFLENVLSLTGEFLPGFLSWIAPVVIVSVPIFFVVRLSLAPVIAVDRKRINFKESWVSTKGHFWPLTGSLALSLLLFVVVALVALFLVLVLGELISIGTGGFIATPGQLLDPNNAGQLLRPAVIIGGVCGGVLVGVFLPVVLGPQVRAYQAYDAPDSIAAPPEPSGA